MILILKDSLVDSYSKWPRDRSFILQVLYLLKFDCKNGVSDVHVVKNLNYTIDMKLENDSICKQVANELYSRYSHSKHWPNVPIVVLSAAEEQYFRIKST